MLTTPPRGHAASAADTPHGAPALCPCPFAHEGLASRRMLACPGYAAQPLTFTGLGAGESLGERVTCRHLGVQRGGRGFISACRHPGGCPA